MDIDAGNELVERIKKMAPNIGGFSGLFPFGDSYLVSGTDGELSYELFQRPAPRAARPTASASLRDRLCHLGLPSNRSVPYLLYEYFLAAIVSSPSPSYPHFHSREPLPAQASARN